MRNNRRKREKGGKKEERGMEREYPNLPLFFSPLPSFRESGKSLPQHGSLPSKKPHQRAKGIWRRERKGGGGETTFFLP